MCKKTTSLMLVIMILLSSILTVGFTAVAETNDENNNSFKAGDTVYFDCSACGDIWTAAEAVEYVNLTQYTRADNGDASVIIAERDTAKYNPIRVTADLGNYKFSYTFTEETAGATCLRFWRGNTEKMWNNSPLLTYEAFSKGNNCIFATDLDGNGNIGAYSSKDYTPVEGLKFEYAKRYSLYAHGITGNAGETEAWQKMQLVDGVNYFFLPSSAEKSSVELYNTFETDVKIGDAVIPANSTAAFNYKKDTVYDCTAGSNSFKLSFMRSSAECAVFVNNGSSFDGKDMLTYLSQDKALTATATGAVVDKDGKYQEAPIKKIKGRGNTSWDKPKKSFNITYNNAISIGGMAATKKFSICANYQDDTLSRNRILYDLADEVGIPYSPNSRYADFYMNGMYMGSYQMCRKIEVGKNQLIDDITGKEYKAEDGSFAKDFPFVLKVDSGVDPGDFTFNAANNNIIMVEPELADKDTYYNEVRNYVTEKFTAMYNAVKDNSSNLGDLADIDTCAKMVLLNELCKNWDVGVSSFYFVYKQDSDGKYKFFACPPWDYDNSLGNAVGVQYMLNSIGVYDYEEPTGLFTTYKGGRKSTTNIASLMYRNTALYKRITQVWYESFVPAIENKLKGKGVNTGKLYSSDVYYDLIKNSAAMNYKMGWLLNPEPQWLCDHSSLKTCTFDYTSKKLTQSSTATTYDANTFKGVWNYCMDWLSSRSAYLSDLYVESYIAPTPITPTEPEVTVPPTQPATEHQVGEKTLVEFNFDNQNRTEGDKLTEYGDKKGYNATFGQGYLFLSMDGENGRALEWSAAEYGTSGTDMIPIMSAGSKNPWGANPYIQIDFDATYYSDLSFTMEIAGSKKAPANWKMQYSTDGETFVDLTDTSFTITEANRKIPTAYINDVKLPASCNGAKKVYIRLIPTSTTTVAGGSYTDAPTSGEIAIGNIKVEGVSTKDGLLGDANLDGQLTVQDAATIQKAIVHKFTLTEMQKKVADFNNDGYIDIRDVTAIQKHIAKA